MEKLKLSISLYNNYMIYYIYFGNRCFEIAVHNIFHIRALATWTAVWMENWSDKPASSKSARVWAILWASV